MDYLAQTKVYQYLEVAFADRSLLRWIQNRQPDVAYVGFINRGNIGDEAMLSTHKRALSNYTLVPAPTHEPGRTLVSAVGGKPTVLLIGGGTLLGHDSWARALARLTDRIPFDHLVVYGPGMEDIEFGLATGVTTMKGLDFWQSFLKHADFVGVRGPRSVQQLSQLGIRAAVVGDPALALSQPARPAWHGPRVAINITSVSNAYSGVTEARRDILALTSTLINRGYRVLGFTMDRGDREALEEGFRNFGIRAPIYEPDTPDAVMAMLAASSFTISERLHGAVLSATVKTPFLHMGYKPKSHDFIESINAEDWLLDVNDFRPGEARERFDTYVTSQVRARTIDSAIESIRTGFESNYTSLLRLLR